MKKSAMVLAAALIGTVPDVAIAQQSGVARTDLQRHDLSIPGRETVQARVDIAPGATAARHSHPGEEIIYVLQGTLEYDVDGKPPAVLKVGDVLFIPRAQFTPRKMSAPALPASWLPMSLRKASRSRCRHSERS